MVEGEKYNVVIVVGGADSKHKVPLKNKYVGVTIVCYSDASVCLYFKLSDVILTSRIFENGGKRWEEKGFKWIHFAQFITRGLQ